MAVIAFVGYYFWGEYSVAQSRNQIAVSQSFFAACDQITEFAHRVASGAEAKPRWSPDERKQAAAQIEACNNYTKFGTIPASWPPA